MPSGFRFCSELLNYLVGLWTIRCACDQSMHFWKPLTSCRRTEALKCIFFSKAVSPRCKKKHMCLFSAFSIVLILMVSSLKTKFLFGAVEINAFLSVQYALNGLIASSFQSSRAGKVHSYVLTLFLARAKARDTRSCASNSACSLAVTSSREVPFGDGSFRIVDACDGARFCGLV